MRIAALLCGVITLVSCGGGDSDNRADPGGDTTPGETTPAETTPAGTGGVIFESDFTESEGGFLEGAPSFRDEGPQGESIEGRYTDHETLSLTAHHKGAGGATNVGVNGLDVFTEDNRELTDLSDVVVEAHATLVERRDGAALYGIRCRENPETAERYEAFVDVDPSGKPHAALVRHDDPNSSEDLAVAEDLPEGIAVEEREWNYLQLSCIGDTISFSIDEQQILEATDDRYASGTIGMFAVSILPPEIDEGRAVVEFDNLRILEP